MMTSFRMQTALLCIGPNHRLGRHQCQSPQYAVRGDLLSFSAPTAPQVLAQLLGSPASVYVNVITAQTLGLPTV